MVIILVLLLINTLPLYSNIISTPIPGGSTLNFTVNLNNVQEARASNSSFTSAPHETHFHTDSPLLNKLAHMWVDPDTNTSLSKRLGTHAGSFLWNNKWYILGSSLLGSYLYVCYTIASGNSYLAQKDLWSSWHQELPLEELLAIPQSQFSKELLQEIQRRYTDPAAVTDLLRPLNTFLIALDKEEEQLRWYEYVYSWIQYAHLNKIIFLSTALFSKLTERLQRLAYIKNVFHSWAAQYQLEHAARRYNSIELLFTPDVHDIAAVERYRYKLLVHALWLRKKEKS